MREILCQQCGKSFQARKSNTKFCSSLCANRARHYGGKTMYKYTCKQCGKKFSRPLKNQKFCSKKCAGLSFHGRPSTNPNKLSKETIEFISDNYLKQSTAWIAQQLNKTETSIRGIWNKYKNKKTGQNHTRNYDSVREYMTNHNPMKNPDIAQKVGEKVKQSYWNNEKHRERYLNSQSVDQRKKASKPELLCKQYLKELGIEFIHSAVIKPKFIVDFKIGNFIIQVDGEYWHGHPRFEPLTDRQVQQKKKDTAQDKYLITCGYTVIRIWESDITPENIRLIVLRFPGLRFGSHISNPHT